MLSLMLSLALIGQHPTHAPKAKAVHFPGCVAGCHCADNYCICPDHCPNPAHHKHGAPVPDKVAPGTLPDPQAPCKTMPTPTPQARPFSDPRFITPVQTPIQSGSGIGAATPASYVVTTRTWVRASGACGARATFAQRRAFFRANRRRLFAGGCHR
jgi:hypothetical protein